MFFREVWWYVYQLHTVLLYMIMLVIFLDLVTCHFFQIHFFFISTFLCKSFYFVQAVRIPTAGQSNGFSFDAKYEFNRTSVFTIIIWFKLTRFRIGIIFWSCTYTLGAFVFNSKLKKKNVLTKSSLI